MISKLIPLKMCRDGLLLDQDIKGSNGAMLANKDSKISSSLLRILKEMGVETIQVKGDFTEEELTLLKPEITPEEVYIQEFSGKYTTNLDEMHNMMKDISNGESIKVEKVGEIIGGFIQKGSPQFDVIKCVDALRSTDEYTYTHSLNVSIYAMLLAKCIKLNTKQVEQVMQAGLLHDIGKAKIPNEILNKPSKLTIEEFEIMKTHSTHSYRLIQDSPEIDINVKKAVLMHHEKENGKGYPIGASGKNLHLYARILAIADVYDALTSTRVYKHGMTPYQAFKIFEDTGIGHFDFQMMNSFMYNIACFYINNKVMLSDGRICEIVFVSPTRISMPTIKFENEYIDLTKHPELEIIKIYT